MKKNNNKYRTKRIIAWLCLFILIIGLLVLNYIKFFGAPNQNIEERPINNSSEQAIQTALKDIVNNFNNSEELTEYSNQNIMIKAILNQHSIFISHTTDSTTTYEFRYSNLNLEINIENNKENIEKFNQVYTLLLKAIQKRINNNPENIDDIINGIINESKTYEGVSKTEGETTIKHQVNITKKLENII